MSADQAYEISNVGGIDHAELKLRPGVNVLRGRNAIGKTSAVRAIVRAQGGGGELERRDGSDHGEVHGPGVMLRVGKVVKTSGTAELELADVSPLSTLIDPGFESTDACARARVRALIELLGLRVDEAAIETMASGDAELLKWLRAVVSSEAIDDLTVASERLRGHTHGLARQQEVKAEEAQGRAASAEERCKAALGKVGGEHGLVETTPGAASENVVAGARAFERAVAQVEAREALEKRQAEIREAIGERPDPAPHEALCGELGREIELRDGEIVKLAAELADVQDRLFRAKAALVGKQVEHTASVNALAETNLAGQRWDEQQKVLDQQPGGHSREDLMLLEDEHVRRPTAAQALAAASNTYRDARAELAEAHDVRESAQKEGGRLRGLALGLSARLAEILDRAGAHGLTVIDGRLHALIDGKAHDFERRLSEGQRVKAALDVAAQVYKGRVVPLAGSYWGALDPENRAEFARLALERELYVISEEPSSGDLRVEHQGA